MIQRFLISIFCICSIALSSQNMNNDFTVVLNEEALNKVFAAIGDIKGSNDYEIMLIKGKYNWTVIKPSISIRPDSSQFNCLAKVEAGLFDYISTVKGDVKITYNDQKNEIQVKITRAVFELYTMILSKKVHIKNIDLADHFKDPFIFEGPRTTSTNFEFTMPDSTIKRIYIQPTACDMEIHWREIVSRCEISATDKAPVPTNPVKVPAKDTVVPVNTPPAANNKANPKIPDTKTQDTKTKK